MPRIPLWLIMLLWLTACTGGSADPVVPTIAPTAASPETRQALFVLPDDGAAPILNAIQSARRAIRLAIYILSDNDTVAALVQAQRRGVDVRVMVEPQPFGGGAPSRDAVAKLKAVGVSVRDTNPTFRLAHQKTLIIDDSVALILNMNLTRAAFVGNREYNIIDADPAHVAEIVRGFEADWNRTAFQPGQTALVWSPENARARLLDHVRAAQATVDIEVEVFTDTSVADTLGALAGRGVRVRVLLPPAEDPADPQVAAMTALSRQGVQVRRLARPYPHAKLIVVDGRGVFIGSQNLSAAALGDNRELGIVLTDSAIVRRAAEVFQSDWDRGQP